MALEAGSHWLTELRFAHSSPEIFDTPRCGFFAWRATKTNAITLAARGYYTQTMHIARELVFAVGSDVLGPMGSDLVPVELEHSEKFAHEHKAHALLKESEVTWGVLKGL